YQTNCNDVSFIEPYECLEPVVLEIEVSSDQNGQTNQNGHNDQNDQSVQNDEILNDDHSKHSNHTNDEQIIVNLRNTKDELNQFTRNKVWTLVPVPYGKTIIGSKWVFRNKKDETGIVIKDKARLVAQGYNHQEGIDYDETVVTVARLEAIRIFLAFSTYMNFESNEFPNHVCKLDKALYRLKQAPRAWYETLSTFLTEHKFVRGFDLQGYSDSDYAGCNMDRKSTSADAGCCANILWIKSQLTDYDIIYEKPLDEPTFKRLIVKLGMLNIDSKPEASVLPEEN
ncbi:retrovirus-related pol polyprotein from transposon TNT 1-94, partial [Tanacetum coccineum]